jgi:hypothetical protein
MASQGAKRCLSTPPLHHHDLILRMAKPPPKVVFVPLVGAGRPDA